MAHRAVYSMITGAGLILIGGNWRQMESLLADRRSMWLLLLSGTLIGGNWLIYIWAVQNDRVIEASLGYFINPLFNFLVGAVLFGERRRLVGWTGFVGHGSLPRRLAGVPNRRKLCAQQPHATE